MCTAITYKTNDSYFGRNLDLEYSYNETVTVTPRNYPLNFRKAETLNNHYAMIGMAYVLDNYPLYYDAVNEHGLAMAGLNFPNNATYYRETKGKDNITPFEFIPWILGKCKNIAETRELLSCINILDLPYSEKLQLSPLHWMIADKNEAITVETMADGMKIYDNRVGVMTNNPPFDFMKNYLATFRDLSSERSVNRIAPEMDLPVYCQGLSAHGLPGDYSSASRFVRASFVKLNSVSPADENGSVGQFFKILNSVEMPRGCVRLDKNVYDITVYTSCVNQNKGIYYYTTYQNSRINAVNMHNEDLDGRDLKSFSLNIDQNIYMHN